MLNYDVCAIVNDNCEKKLVEREEKAEQKKMIVLSILLGIVTILIAITLFLICNMDTEAKAKPKECVRVEKQIMKKYGKRVRFYDTKDIDEYIIVTRKDKKRVVVERATKFRKGNKVVSYLVYNPATYYIDDVIERIDVVAKK